MPVYSVKGHQEIINGIDGCGGLGIGGGAPEIVTGSRDGKDKHDGVTYNLLKEEFTLDTKCHLFDMQG